MEDILIKEEKIVLENDLDSIQFLRHTAQMRECLDCLFFFFWNKEKEFIDHTD